MTLASARSSAFPYQDIEAYRAYGLPVPLLDTPRVIFWDSRGDFVAGQSDASMASRCCDPSSRRDWLLAQPTNAAGSLSSLHGGVFA